jgi:hypothetical protein
MIRKLCCIGLVALLVSSSVTCSSAVPISGLYNTGLDSFGNYLATGQPDGNYSVIASPLGPFTPVAVDDTTFPFPPWVPNNPTASRWIGPQTNTLGPFGFYRYRTSFFLPANATNVMLSGLWGTDDPGLNIFINGIPTGQFSLGFTTLVPFSVTSGFIPGATNNLDFRLLNVVGPTGLRIDKIQGKYDLIPEPLSLNLVAGGATMLLARRRPKGDSTR